MDLGLAGMFGSAFLAATILPLGSEVVMGYLLINGHNAQAVVGVATLGNVLGSLVNYWMGLAGSRWMVNKISGVSPGELDKARARFKAYGTGSLVFAWVPVIGDPLTVVAGILKVNIVSFLLLVTLGKLARYLVVAAGTQLF